MKKASAVVTFSGGLTSHPAIVGLNIGIPVVVNTGDISDDFKDGEILTVDGVRGLVYRGQANLK
jgi:pyruvate kinase